MKKSSSIQIFFLDYGLAGQIEKILDKIFLFKLLGHLMLRDLLLSLYSVITPRSPQGIIWDAEN